MPGMHNEGSVIGHRERPAYQAFGPSIDALLRRQCSIGMRICMPFRDMVITFFPIHGTALMVAVSREQ